MSPIAIDKIATLSLTGKRTSLRVFAKTRSIPCSMPTGFTDTCRDDSEGVLVSPRMDNTNALSLVGSKKDTPESSGCGQGGRGLLFGFQIRVQRPDEFTMRRFNLRRQR